MRATSLPRRAVLNAVLTLTSVAALSSSANASGILRRIFGGHCCQPQNVVTAPSTQHQSFSYEPGGGATAPQVSPRPYGGTPQYRGVYRVEPGSTIPNMFRADRKIRGLQSN